MGLSREMRGARLKSKKALDLESRKLAIDQWMGVIKPASVGLALVVLCLSSVG
jgi:hypothetical protein